jgi:hypothetical protein
MTSDPRWQPGVTNHTRSQIVTRPRGITALGCLFVFGVFASGLATVSLLFPGGALEPVWRLNPRAREAFERMGPWPPLLLGAVCVACAFAAYGLFHGRPWGYRLTIVLLLVNLAGDLINAGLGIEPRAFIGIPIVAVLLAYLASRKVRAYFALAAASL